MVILLFIIAYILNLFFNRWLYFKINQKEIHIEEEIGITLSLLSLYGTIYLICLYFVYSDFFNNEKSKKMNKFFDLIDNSQLEEELEKAKNDYDKRAYSGHFAGEEPSYHFESGFNHLKNFLLKK